MEKLELVDATDSIAIKAEVIQLKIQLGQLREALDNKQRIIEQLEFDSTKTEIERQNLQLEIQRISLRHRAAYEENRLLWQALQREEMTRKIEESQLPWKIIKIWWKIRSMIPKKVLKIINKIRSKTK